MDNFTHLHVHSYFSILDGLGSPKEYVSRAKELGQTALALTDHGETSGLYEHQKECEEQGIKPILGSEFYFEDIENSKVNGHLVVLAKNQKGLENIFRMQEIAFVDNFYRKPRINMKILRKHKEGLVVTSACLANPINRFILNEEYDLAQDRILEFHSIFKDDFYLEIQPNNILEQFTVNKQLIQLSDMLGIQLVATNDVHYVLKEDGALKDGICFDKDGKEVEVTYSIHEVLLASQMGTTLFNEDRFKFDVQDFWLKSRKEMKDSFVGYSSYEKDKIEEALNNTNIIADKCNARIVKGNFLPHFHDVETGKTENQMLRELVTSKYKTNIINKGLHNKDYAKDVFKELKVIEEEGYSGYFLIVQDYANHARNTGMPIGDGRGSACGCKVAHVLNITTVNPQKYGLLFERFLAHNRVPDIDLDFADIDMMFKYLQDVYGKRNVAKIRTFGRLKAKACIRKVFKVFNHPQYIINNVAKSIPDVIDISIEKALEMSDSFYKFKTMYPDEFEVCMRFENVISNVSMHAGGIIIWNDLSKTLPVTSTTEDRSRLIVGFNMDELEELGYFKFDVLGLQTLEIIERTLDNIKKVTGENIDVTQINEEDEEVYKLFQRGQVSGVFQLEEQAEKVMQQQPSSFADLIAINALIRPGVCDWSEYLGRRNGSIEYKIHPDREAYLKDTYGLIVYQEQFLLDCHILAGWDIAFADKKVRKNKDILNDVELKKKFVQDGIKNNYDENFLLTVWSEIEGSVSGGYNFNKSHATSYAKLTYRTAWLKHYYPKEFLSALATQRRDDKAQIAKIIAEAKQQGITILPPDINISTDEFVPTSDGVRYMLTAINDLGAKASNAIFKKRPFKSIEDLIERTTKQEVNKSALTNLIKAGAFDKEDDNRIRLLNKAYKLRGYKEDILPEGMWDETAKLIFEKESISLYLTTHPMEKYNYQKLESFKENEEATIAGEIVKINEVKDRRGNKMAFVELDTGYGITTILLFSWMWEQYKELIQQGYIYETIGKRSGDKILANNIKKL